MQCGAGSCAHQTVLPPVSSFLAFWGLPSWSFFLRNVQPAIFANSPEVDADQQNRGQRQDHAVQHIESEQRIGVNLISSEHQETNLFAHQRNSLGDVGAHSYGPE